MKRYEFYNSYGDAFMIESTDGEYVKYDDHIALLNKSSDETKALTQINQYCNAQDPRSKGRINKPAS